jgi:plasmid maintenance system killer protein
MERGKMVWKHLEKITHGSAMEFINTLCQQLLQDGDDDRVRTFSTKLGEQWKLIYLYQHEVLQLDSAGENYQKLENIVKEIRTLVGWLDEISVLTLLDITEVQRLYDASELLFQKQ